MNKVIHFPGHDQDNILLYGEPAEKLYRMLAWSKYHRKTRPEGCASFINAANELVDAIDATGFGYEVLT